MKVTVTADEYIALYGASLTEAEKSYIRAFGPPQIADPGASRNPYTTGLHIADAPPEPPLRTPRTEGTIGTAGSVGYYQPD